MEVGDGGNSRGFGGGGGIGGDGGWVVKVVEAVEGGCRCSGGLEILGVGLKR